MTMQKHHVLVPTNSLEHAPNQNPTGPICHPSPSHALASNNIRRQKLSPCLNGYLNKYYLRSQIYDAVDFFQNFNHSSY
jgi:hypothetical protein